jgi:hypothetical protein
MPNSTKRLTCFIVIILFLATLSACAKTEREKEVYQFIQDATELAEGHNLGDLMDLAQDGFIVEPGNRSSKEVRRILFITFKRFGRFRIHYPKPSVKLSEDEDTAIVKMNFLIAKKDQLFPELKMLYEDTVAWLETVDKHADVYTLSMELGYESGSWLVKKARITGFARPHGRL